MCSRGTCLLYGLEVLDAVRRYVASSQCDCIALSGGLDTSLVALAARLEHLRLKSVTVYYERGLPRDLWYASSLARVLGFEHEAIPVDDGYIASRSRLVLDCTRRLDYIEVRNDVVFLAALEWSRARGCKCIYTGDGGDELFAGYEFTRRLWGGALREAQVRLGVRGRYPALELAECMGVDARAPLLSDEVVEVAMHAPTCCLLGERLEGKYLVRLVLDEYGLGWLAWRPKTPAEGGAGTDALGREALEAITGLRLGLHA